MFLTDADIDECESGTHNCSGDGETPAQCINLPGGFTCSCDQHAGYSLSTNDYATCVGEPFRIKLLFVISLTVSNKKSLETYILLLPIPYILWEIFALFVCACVCV